MLNQVQKAYLAGFLDGDGSVYVQAKPNPTYKYGFQVAPYIVLFQSQKDKENFAKICRTIGFGYLRERKDGILEYIIGRANDIRELIRQLKPYLILKKEQAELIIQILDAKENVKNEEDFRELLKLIDSFRELNYSKTRKRR